MTRKTIDARCTITVNHTMEALEAHVELDNGLKPTAGDRVLVHGAPVHVLFGEQITLRRKATLIRANAFQKLWIKFKSLFELTELYEVSFTPGRIR